MSVISHEYAMRFVFILVIFSAIASTVWNLSRPSDLLLINLPASYPPITPGLHTRTNTDNADIIEDFIALTYKTSKKDYPQDFFGSPLSIPLFLSGSFGELRTNHFHAGIDIKTQGRERLPVLAAGDGYVSRVKIAASGYGKTIYINHPNGYTTVYGHLNELNASLASFVRNEQYKTRQFEIDLEFAPDEFRVKKGQQIALSGNTGSTGAPHLHFEIRDTDTENALNPLLFNLPVSDMIFPFITSLLFYPGADMFCHIEPGIEYKVKALGNHRYSAGVDTLRINAESVGIAARTFDQINGSTNWNGIYKLSIYDNDLKIYEMTADDIPFDDSKYINAHLDYYKEVVNDASYNKCFVEPGNFLRIYETINKGIISLADGLPHPIRLEVRDVKGNLSTLQINLLRDAQGIYAKDTLTTSPSKLTYESAHHLSYDETDIHFPERCFYRDLCFEYKLLPRESGNCYSSIHHIDNYTTPVHSGYELRIKGDKVPAAQRDKALIVYREKAGSTPKPVSMPVWEGDWISGRAYKFGQYFIAIDQTPPAIVPRKNYAKISMATLSQMMYKITDDLSGIASYNMYIDDSWVLAEYDKKYHRITHTFESDLSRGQHIMRLVVKDMVGNEREYLLPFKR